MKIAECGGVESCQGWYDYKTEIDQAWKSCLINDKKCSSPDVEIFKMTFSIFLGRYLNSYLWKLKMALLKEFDEINLEEQNKNILHFVKCKVAWS